MKKVLFAMMLLFATAVHAQSICGVYVNQMGDMYEDQYLVIEQDENGKLSGYYYGTTDDFDDVREGYRVGFFVSKVEDLVANEHVVEFKVNVNTANAFSSPVPLTARSLYEAAAILKPWTVYGAVAKSFTLKLTVVRDGLVYEAPSPFDSKLFVRVTNNRILKAVETGRQIHEYCCCKKENTNADVAPRLVNPDLSFEDYISSNVYRETKTHCNTPITISFTVRCNGSVDDIRVSSEQNVAKKTQELIEYYVKNSPAWMPGMKKNSDLSTCNSTGDIPTCTRVMFNINLR